MRQDVSIVEGWTENSSAKRKWMKKRMDEEQHFEEKADEKEGCTENSSAKRRRTKSGKEKAGTRTDDRRVECSSERRNDSPPLDSP